MKYLFGSTSESRDYVPRKNLHIGLTRSEVPFPVLVLYQTKGNLQWILVENWLHFKILPFLNGYYTFFQIEIRVNAHWRINSMAYWSDMVICNLLHDREKKLQIFHATLDIALITFLFPYFHHNISVLNPLQMCDVILKHTRKINYSTWKALGNVIF